MNSKLITLILTIGSVALAQGPRGPQPNNPAPGSGSGLDMTKVQGIEGTVSAVNIGYGAQYPSLQINQTTVKVAPVWFLIEKDFEVKVGDTLKVTAAPSLTAKDPYLSAITIANAVTGASITLRDATGIPLWTSAGSRRGTPPGQGTHANYGLAAIVTVTGTVDQVTAGVGIQMPALVLKTADGKLLTLKIGPERVLAAADFEIKPGEVLTVRYAACSTGELLALELTNASGVTLVLRNDDGTLAWN